MYQLKKLCRLHKLTDSCLMLYSGTKHPVSSNFIYLTGLNIPNLVVLYDSKKLLFFYDFTSDPWNDHHTLFTTIKKYSKQIHDIQGIISYLPKDKKIYGLIGPLPESVSLLKTPIDQYYLNRLCGSSRFIKTSREIKTITKATNYTSQAIMELWRNFKKKDFNNCQQIVVFLKCFLERLGVYQMAYPPICTVGQANQYLHSSVYNYQIKSSQLILLDIGGRYQNYCSDITRTFPASGKFTHSQKKIYTIVLEIQEFAIGAIRIGAKWRDLEDQCYLKIYDALSDIDLILPKRQKTTRKEKIALGRLFMKHDIGHSIGLDVHDSVDSIKEIKPNMVIAIEIGIYFSTAQLKHPRVQKTIWKKYRALGGIRIEDVVRVNKIGKAIVVSDVPKSIQSIEEILRGP